MKFKALQAAFAVSLAAGTGAQAAQFAALIRDDTIVMIDTDAKKATKSMEVADLNGALMGIDVRRSEGMLYGTVADRICGSGVRISLGAPINVTTGQCHNAPVLLAPIPHI